MQDWDGRTSAWTDLMREDGHEQIPLTEPVIVPCLYLTGGEIEIGAGVVRFVGWTQMPGLGGQTEERRIEVRFALPVEEARRLAAKLQHELRKRAS